MNSSSNMGTARSRELPHSDIRATAARVMDVSKIESSAWSHGGEYVVQQSIIVEFTNHPARSGAHTEPTVAASLTYQDAKRDILQIAGGWIDSTTPLARFKVNQSHKLLIGYVQDGHFVAVEFVPGSAEGAGHAGLASHDQLQKLHQLPDFHHGLVCVSLTDVHTHHLLYDSCFEIGVNPLRISQNITHQP